MKTLGKFQLLNELFNTKGPALPWTLLTIVYALGNLFIQGLNHVAWTYTWVYTLAFLLIAITLAKAYKDQAIGAVFAIMTVFVGTMTWITSMSPSYTNITPFACMIITIIFTAIAFANEFRIIETKASVNNKYALLAAIGGIFLFGLLYLLGRLGLLPPYFIPGPLQWHTILNHVGITLLAGTDMFILVGLGTWDKWARYRWVFLALTVIGALAMLSAGWGLAIRPT